MDTAIADGDFLQGKNGMPYLISGEKELLQRALIRLTVPQGSLRYDPQFGSRLYELRDDDDNARALALAQEALKPLPQLTAVSAVYQKEEPQKVNVRVCWERGESTLEVKI